MKLLRIINLYVLVIILIMSCSSPSTTLKENDKPSKANIVMRPAYISYDTTISANGLIAAYNEGDTAGFFIRLDSLDFKKCQVSEYEEKIEEPHSAIFGFPFTLEKDAQQVCLLLFNQENKLIDVIFNTRLGKGKYMTFFASLFDKLPEGIYNLMLRVADEKTFKRITLLR